MFLFRKDETAHKSSATHNSHGLPSWVSAGIVPPVTGLLRTLQQSRFLPKNLDQILTFLFTFF